MSKTAWFWLVFTSIENFDHDRCVDLFSRPDGSFGFEEFRRDPEDRGEWTPVKYYSNSAYGSQEAAFAAAISGCRTRSGKARPRKNFFREENRTVPEIQKGPALSKGTGGFGKGPVPDFRTDQAIALAMAVTSSATLAITK